VKSDVFEKISFRDDVTVEMGVPACTLREEQREEECGCESGKFLRMRL
jgi:hypothetical protein